MILTVRLRRWRSTWTVDPAPVAGVLFSHNHGDLNDGNKLGR